MKQFADYAEEARQTKQLAKTIHDALVQLETPLEYQLQVLLALNKGNDSQFSLGIELIRLMSD